MAKDTVIRVNQQPTEWEKFLQFAPQTKANIQNLQRTKTDLQELNKLAHSKVGNRYEDSLYKRRHT